MKNVTLKIVGTQLSVEGEQDQIELTTEGKYYEKNGCIFLVYDESELSGMEGSTTTLKIKDKQVMMKRFGSNESELIFEENKKHTTHYLTPYGTMQMHIVTSEIKIDMNDDCIDCIDIIYDINISKNTDTRNTLSVKVEL